jgi:hypothetical protein
MSSKDQLCRRRWVVRMLASSMVLLVVGPLEGAGPGTSAPAALQNRIRGNIVQADRSAARPRKRTVVAIHGTRFYINGARTYRGTRAEGLLLNTRMVQAAFDDENPATATAWRYPDTRRWSADRNVREFVNALPSYAAKGLNAITINLQGGSPRGGPDDAQPNVTSAFRADGTLKSSWLQRVDRIVRACAANRIVVIVGYFYFGQDQRLANERAVLAGVDNATKWLVKQRYTNVLVEINNEANLNYNHDILKPQRVEELISRVKSIARGYLKVSTSFAGGTIPPDAVIRASDFVLLHGNGQNAASVRQMVERVRATQAYRALPKPVVFNEDSTNLANLDAAVEQGASWGYYDQGSSNYVDGFQSPPVNWRINTSSKRAFFEKLATLSARKR